MKRAKAIVVGAGLAGLTAAWRLQQAGFEVTVLEKLDRVGGRVLTLRRDGFVIDAGPDAMTEGYQNYQAIARDVGLETEFVPSSQVMGLIRDGKVIDIDPAKPVSALFTKALSWPAKLRAAWGIFRMRKMLVGINSFRLTDSASLDSETDHAESFSLRYFGREVTDRLIDPMIRLTVGNTARYASRLGVLGALVNWSVSLINIKGGLDVLPKALAKHLPVQTGVEVEQVRDIADGVEVVWRDAQGTRQSAQADVCVIAATYDVTERIYPRLAEYVPGYREKLSFQPFVSVTLAFTAPTTSRAYLVLVPTVESADALLIFLQHNKAPDRAPAGQSLITVYTDGMVTERYFAKSDEEIEAWARKEIEGLFPELVGSFKFSSISRWPIAGYRCVPGFFGRTRQLLDRVSQSSRVQIAGDLFGAGSMEAAVTWGDQAARNIIEHHPAIGQQRDASLPPQGQDAKYQRR